MNDYVIPLSRTTLRRQLIVSAILVLVACLVTTFFFQYAVSAAPGLQRTLMIVLWVGMPVLWIVGVLVAEINFRKTSYILTDDALSVQKSGILGRGSTQLCGYETIMSVNSTSRRYGAYGSIELILDQQASVILHNVASPDEQARHIKKRVAEAKKTRQY